MKQLRIIEKKIRSEFFMDSYIEIDGWKSNIRFSSAHIIPEYEKCGRLHGHTYAVHLKIFGKTDDKGIIMDFSLVKEQLKKIINKLDHRVLIPNNSSVVKIEKTKDSIKINSLGKEYVFPICDCALLAIESTSAENLASFILKEIIDNVSFPDRIESVEIGVDEGYGQGARILKKL